MPYPVSSDFLVEMESKNPNYIRRKFTIGGSDYTSYVTSWPKYKKRWNDLRPINISIRLSNEGQAFNFFKDTPWEINNTTKVNLGVGLGSGQIIRFTGESAIEAEPPEFVTNNDLKVEIDSLYLPPGEDNYRIISQASSGGFSTEFALYRPNDHELRADIAGSSFTISSSIGIDFGSTTIDGNFVFDYDDSLNEWSTELNSSVVTTGTDVNGTEEYTSVKLFIGGEYSQNSGSTNNVPRLTTMGEVRMTVAGTLQRQYTMPGYGKHIEDLSSAETGTVIGYYNEPSFPTFDWIWPNDATQEEITLHEGKISNVKYTRTGATLSIVDKIKPFSERVVGDTENPVDFTGSDYFPHDLAWYLATSYGGLDSTQSSANPDIDWTDFLEWAGVFTTDTIKMQAYFDGNTLNECFRKLGRVTKSSIFVEDSKLRFARYTESTSIFLALGSDPIIDVSGVIDDKNIINNHITYADYNVNSDTYSVIINNQESASVNSYGQRDKIEKDTNIWYISSATALNFSQRNTSINKNPYMRYNVQTTLAPITRFIGDLVSVQYDFLGLDGGQKYRIMGYNVDLDKCRMSIEMDESQIVGFFKLDVDQMDIGILG